MKIEDQGLDDVEEDFLGILALVLMMDGGRSTKKKGSKNEGGEARDPRGEKKKKGPTKRKTRRKPRKNRK